MGAAGLGTTCTTQLATLNIKKPAKIDRLSRFRLDQYRLILIVITFYIMRMKQFVRLMAVRLVEELLIDCNDIRIEM